MSEERRGISRREAIAGAAAAGAGAAAVVLLRSGGSDDPVSPAASGAAAEDVSAETTAAESPNCVLAPEQTEGPYYIDDGLVRSNITEGKRGVALKVRLRVVDADSCKPIRGALVEIWHCDALGNYSGFSDAGSDSFLRGGQRTNAAGYATFRTIYPGWYQGRTTHIHCKVHVGGQEVHTGQLYFNDRTNAVVYGSRSPYRSRGQKDTPNSADGIYGDGGAESTVRLAKSGSGYLGRLSLGVRA